VIGLPALVGSFLTAAAYLTGVAFQQAYLISAQVNDELFVKSSSDYFLFAFQAIPELIPAGLCVWGENFDLLGAIFGLLLLGKPAMKLDTVLLLKPQINT
jgi:hypothetical protein